MAHIYQFQHHSRSCKLLLYTYNNIVMQALVDSYYLFRDVAVWPGRFHDATVFFLAHNCTFWGVVGGYLLINMKEEILGKENYPVTYF